jgi:hypothetical protein
MTATTALALVMAAWLAIGVVSGITMGRRGHDGFTWMLLGATLGPLVVPLALSTQRRTGPSKHPAARSWPQASRRRPRRRRRSPRMAAAWLFRWIAPAGIGRLSLVAVGFRSPSVAADRGYRSAPDPNARWSSSNRTCASAMEGYPTVGTPPPAGLNGRRAAQVRRRTAGSCLTAARRQGGGREER